MNELTESLGNLHYVMRRPIVRFSGVGTIALVSLCVAVVLGYWWPAAEQFASLKQEIAVSRKKMVATAQLKPAKVNYRRTIQALERLEAKLATKVSQADMIDQVSKLANKSNLKVLSEGYAEKRQLGGFGSLNQELSLLGSYKSLRKFIAGLHSLPTWTILESVQLERAPQNRALVKANLKIATNYRLLVADSSER